MQPYNLEFYRRFVDGMIQSAKEIVPIILGLVQPKSVVDVGCGVGAWLSVFRQHGIDDILGIDGHYIDSKMLLIPDNCFWPHDLKEPFKLARKFDLVMCLEVAEHLPSECAESLVDSLISLGPVICFSAAIPLQGGTRSHHVNEQWPEYWAAYFNKKGYVTIDCLRRQLWKNENVEFWYAQNMLVFVRKDYLINYPLLEKEYRDTIISQLSIVHPKCYLTITDPKNSLLRLLTLFLPVALIDLFTYKFKSKYSK